MGNEVVMFLSTTPYSFENTHTILKLADALLRKGGKARLALEDLVGRGLKVDI
jgi:hypothetical protein